MIDVYIYKPNFPSDWESGRIENGSWTGSIDCVNVLSRYSSLIWTERYNQYGEFELYLPVCDVLSELLVRGNLLRIAKSKKWMVIEDIAVDTDPETGPMFTITGRSLESLLDRRVNLLVSEGKISSPSSYAINSTTKVTYAARFFVSRNFTQASGTFWRHRLCPNFYCVPYNDYSDEDSVYYDASLAALTLGNDDYENYAGSTLNSENVYDVTEAICQNYDVGFAVDIQNGTNSFNSNNIKYTGDYFNFYLYYGKDRSLEQSDNTPVVLSGFFHTLQSSNYYESDRDYKNTMFVITDEDASFNSTNYYSSNTGSSPSGLNIREAYESYSTSDSVSASKLRAEAKRTLEDLTGTTTLECELAQTDQFVYGEDYYLGDVISVVTDYGITATVRVSEVVFSCDDSGESTTATVELIDSSGSVSTGEEEDEDEGSDDSD